MQPHRKNNINQPDTLELPGSKVSTKGYTGLQLNTSTQKPPAAYDDGSDNFEVCRSVAVVKDWTQPNYKSSGWELSMCL